MSKLEAAYSLTTHVELEKESINGNKPPALRAKRLTLSTLTLVPAVFQFRLLEDKYTQGESKRQVETLMNNAMNEPNRNLDPIPVWWSGGRWVLIDGHHRYEAYRQLNKIGKRNSEFPVEVFKGTLEEARRHAAYLNRKTKLAMTGADRTNASWQQV
jgi:hypothetical protein